MSTIEDFAARLVTEKRIVIPIDRIYNISVHCEFIITDFGYATFTIKSWNTHQAMDIEYELYYQRSDKIEKDEDVFKLVKFIFDIIPKLKFDKCIGRFVREIVRPDYTIFEAFEQCDFIKMTYAQCCVCHERTTTKTECNHHLCIQCWDQLKEVEKDNRHAFRYCPLCREEI